MFMKGAQSLWLKASQFPPVQAWQTHIQAPKRILCQVELQMNALVILVGLHAQNMSLLNWHVFIWEYVG
jgi:hypothetical protein